jgi:Zn-dependent protease
MSSPLWDLISNGSDALPSFLSFVVAIVVAITVHEFAHAKAAQKAGDPTPEQHGRVTLNPLAHFDPIGTVALLIAGFGWGRPVPTNPFLMRRPRIDNILVSLWGPLSNLIVAAVFAIPLRFRLAGDYDMVFRYLVLVNLVLCIFNLIPIHPLDGSHIVSGLLPVEQARKYDTFGHQFGFVVLLLLLITGGVGYVLGLPVEFAYRVLTGMW